MYKSKLQEVCQNKKWALPKYCCMKDGEDHNPKFKASVVVNGINFDSPPSCKSSKEAHNEAAKFAFLHFTSGCFVTEDSHYQYKMKLQIYAKRKKLGVPVYHSKRKSSSRDIYFEATVEVAGQLFKSPGAYKTAEDAVAQLALMKLVTVAFEKSNTSSCKSFLQELAQHDEFCLPDYKTISVGERHNLKFFSSVEIEGEIFHGDGAKSKKQAEENAAKVAYTALTKCKSFHADDPSIVSSDLEREIVKTEPRMDSLSISVGQEKFKGLSHSFHHVFVPTNVIVSFITGILMLLSIMALADEKKMVNASRISLGVQELSVDEKSPSAMIPPESSTVSNANSSARKTAETKSYLLSNRFRVYKSIPDEVFPLGTIVLPIAEDKWAVVSLQFPNEKCG
ncbi:hypothetical protein RND71_040643 [Anisodus tanguticus]|uniref:DRBM domain-containing protein n=1 Tax=Anisodus tanguticus TaxID=243964 RepID=A0AAE1QTT1_9SOLA|nr:hypothetical protein RND71_040643 [Anisodus tanguticus]